LFSPPFPGSPCLTEGHLNRSRCYFFHQARFPILYFFLPSTWPICPPHIILFSFFCRAFSPPFRFPQIVSSLPSFLTPFFWPYSSYPSSFPPLFCLFFSFTFGHSSFFVFACPHSLSFPQSCSPLFHPPYPTPFSFPFWSAFTSLASSDSVLSLPFPTRFYSVHFPFPPGKNFEPPQVDPQPRSSPTFPFYFCTFSPKSVFWSSREFPSAMPTSPPLF